MAYQNKKYRRNDARSYVRITCYAFVIILLFPAFHSAFAVTNKHTVSVITGERNIGPATIDISYSVDFDFERPDSMKPGESVYLYLTPTDGKLKITVSVAGRIYSIDKDIPLGYQSSINLAPGIDVYVSTSASGTPTVNGPATISPVNLNWNDNSKRSIPIFMLGSAKNGDGAVVRVPIAINLDAGLNLNAFGIIKYNLGQVRLGSFDAYPVIEESIPVGSVLPTYIIITILVVVGIAGFVIWAVKFRRKKNGNTQERENPVPNSSSHTPVQFGHEKKQENNLEDSLGYEAIKTTEEKVLEHEQNRVIDLSEELKTRLIEGKIGEETYKELKRDLEIRKDGIDTKLSNVREKGESARKYVQKLYLKKNTWDKIGVIAKKGDRIFGTIQATGSFVFYLSDNEHLKKFEKSLKIKEIEFYSQGRSSNSFSHDFGFDCYIEREYRIMILNLEKRKIEATVEYTIDKTPDEAK